MSAAVRGRRAGSMKICPKTSRGHCRPRPSISPRESIAHRLGALPADFIFGVDFKISALLFLASYCVNRIFVERPALRSKLVRHFLHHFLGGMH